MGKVVLTFVFHLDLITTQDKLQDQYEMLLIYDLFIYVKDVFLEHLIELTFWV